MILSITQEFNSKRKDDLFDVRRGKVKSGNVADSRLYGREKTGYSSYMNISSSERIW